jgi:hypothetical protein
MYSPKQQAAKRRYYEKNKELVKARATARRLANPEAGREARKRWYDENPEQRRKLAIDYYRKNRIEILARRAVQRRASGEITTKGRRYRGLPEPTRPQPTHCELDGRPLEPGKVHLDHDHNTGAFRGWLCNRCNLALGHFGDSIADLELGIAYLRKYG